MAASAGTLVLLGARTGKTYSVDVYIPDATGTLLTFNSSGLAATTSSTTYRAVEDCFVVDVSTAAAPTAVGFALTINGNILPGGAIRWANQLNTLANRQKLAVPVRAGDFIGAVQF